MPYFAKRKRKTSLRNYFFFREAVPFSLKSYFSKIKFLKIIYFTHDNQINFRNRKLACQLLKMLLYQVGSYFNEDC